MRKRFILLTTLFSVFAACAPSDASAQVPAIPPAARLPRLPRLRDSGVETSMRKAREVLAHAQWLLDQQQTVLNARLQEADAHLRTVFEQMDAHQAALEETLRKADAHLRTVFEQVERMQRRLDEITRE